MSNNMNNNSAYMPVGTTLQSGKYRIESHLASGGFGNTYKAKNLFFDEIVAIKEFYMKGVTHRDTETMKVCVSNDDNEVLFMQQREKFLKEARRIYKLSKMGSGNIVDVKDFFEENGTAYYVMGFLEGESLAKKVKLAEPFHRLPQKEIYGYIMQILDALEVVHNENLFHLDLKPGNVMVDSKGKAVLIDFGASKQTNPDGSDATKTALCYTPGYAPLEQMEQEIENLGAWTDLYSLGATVFYMLSGKVPPKPIKLIQEGDNALKFPDDITPQMRSLVVKLMKPNRNERFQSVAEVRQWMLKNIKKPDKLPDVINEENDSDATEIISKDILDRKKKEKEERERKKREEKENEERKRQELAERERREKEQRERQRELEKETVVKPLETKDNREENRRQALRESPSRQTYAEMKEAKTPNKLALSKTTVGIAAAAFLVVLLGALGLKKCTSQPKESAPETVAVSEPETKDDSAVEDMKLSNSLGEYLYTGTIDENNLPHGRGKAVFLNSKTAKSYSGPFVHGVMEGPDAVYEFVNGDSFSGSFKEGHFDEGKLTIGNSGEYYMGKFGADGMPVTDEKGNLSAGAWYDKNGNKL